MHHWGARGSGGFWGSGWCRADVRASFTAAQTRPAPPRPNSGPTVCQQCNTERKEFSDKGMNHWTGGWPRDVDPSDVDQTTRFLKKISKDEAYVKTIEALGEVCVPNFRVPDLFEVCVCGSQLLVLLVAMVTVHVAAGMCRPCDGKSCVPAVL